MTIRLTARLGTGAIYSRPVAKNSCRILYQASSTNTSRYELHTRTTAMYRDA